MIPEKIHYIWFGGRPKPASVEAAIAGWRRVLPHHQIMEWNEGNFDIAAHPWMKRMADAGRFAFASDWARLEILRQHGGIYLDTDVELLRPLDVFMGREFFLGFEYECYLGTFLLGSRANHPLLAALQREYDGMEGPQVNNAVFTRFFLREFPEFRLNNRSQ